MKEFELKQVAGTKCYFVDCERQEAYSFRNGMLRKLKARTKYKKISLKLDGKTVGSTVYRMIYSAQHGIDLRRIPSDLCVTMTGGGFALVDRSKVTEKSARERWGGQKSYDITKKCIRMIDQFYEGETLPLLTYLHKVEQSITAKFVFEHGLSEERAQIVAAYGVDRFLDNLKAGCPTPHIFTRVLRYAKGENHRISKTNSIIDEWEKYMTAR